ncbi:MAG: 2Fe-2S iron-sulfur cluster-binding protein [Pseudomonas sp.]|uniref:2Fe-2S iron-sulfur cluster-binding protein n=1 Tax=Pseudomonas sp. TaxID=306 RepID=UPI002726EE3E|nr:2Fe-2S iron-sulfur cluster-binding protein [Pseudomonas sp.]MDO9327872.1 2Fe-2S iron-sulfur cluster-binding protein [Pseudomonas sp.]
MTSLYLLLWIAGGILLQLALYGCIVFWRHWQAYRALRNVAAEFEIAVLPEAAPELMPPVAAWAGYRTFHVERKVPEDASAQVCSFYLVPEEKQPLPPFLPGQFLTFQLDIPSLAGGTQAVIRCYSLSDAPHAGHYRISVKRASPPIGSQVPPGRSSNYFHDHVAVGSLLQVRAPAGHFYLDPSDAPVVLIGGGIGITPMLSMLNWCLTAQPGRELWLFYGVRNRAELVMQTQLQALAAQHANFHLHLCLSKPQAGELGEHRSGPVLYHRSRVDVALLRRLLPLKPYHFYLCGPTSMLQSLVPALEDWGVPEGRIHFEAFGPASIPRKKPASGTRAAAQGDAKQDAVMVSFAKSGKQVAWDPAMGSLLEFAENHGIAVSSGCRAGACGSCQTPIRAGEVAYAQAPDFDPEPGSCLLCVCTPKTDVTLEA